MLSRRPVRQLLAGLLATLLIAAGCTSPAPPEAAGPGPDDTIAEFIGHWSRLDLDKAAALTTAPDEADQLLTTVITNLEPTDVRITAGPVDRTADDAATVPVTFAWGLDGVGTWTYDAAWTWQRSGRGENARWNLVWAPAVIHPKLAPQQTIALRTSETDDGVLVDRNDQPLVGPVKVYTVQLAPTEVTDLPATAKKLAGVLGRFDPTITQAAIVEGVGKADPEVGYTVINLREGDFTAVRAKLAGIEGVTTPSEIRQLPPTKDFAKAVLGEVSAAADTLSTGTDGWRIVAIDAAGDELTTLSEKAPEPGAKVIVTLDSAMQQAAEKLLATVPEQAALVAIQPSTGEILTVAQNAPANVEGPIALMGRYPPGSTFKIVTATAAFERTLVTPTTDVACPGRWVIDSRPIRNDFEFDLGTVPLTLAFAKSCNTTFAELSTKMPADALTKAGKQYGVGLDFVIPGITTLTGQVPAADTVTQAAENGFGQGLVLVSPFSAALMAATAATDEMPVPTIIRGTKTTVDQEVAKRPAKAAAGVRTLMRAVVTEGTATLLGDVGTVSAKTGTAEYTDSKGDLKAHAWTVGYRGDVAFAVLIVGGDSSKRTTQLAHDWLAAIGS